MDDDPLTSLFTLEDSFQTIGYDLGYTDGLRQSRLEARLFGIETAFSKFIVLSKLRARALILAARLQETGTISTNRDANANLDGKEKANEKSHISTGIVIDHTLEESNIAFPLPTTISQPPRNSKITTKTLSTITPLSALSSLHSISTPRLQKHIQTLLVLLDPSTLSMANTDDAVAEFDDRLKRAQAKEKIIERMIGEEGNFGRSGGAREIGGGGEGGGGGDMESFAGMGSRRKGMVV